MADKPTQFQMAYNTGQDRMLLRVNTQKQAEYRLWLTRRVIRALWEGLMKVMEATPDKSRPIETRKREAMLNFDHQAAVTGADFDTPFEESAKNFPLGEDGLLVSSLGIGKSPEGIYTLKLGLAEGNQFSVNFNDRLLHSFMKMLIDSSANAQWELDLRLPASASAASGESASGKVLRH